MTASGPADAVCVLTHDPKFDVPAIISALGTDVGYLGVMGSRTTHARRMQRLAEEGVTAPEMTDRIMAPIGLDIGARTPEETAVAVCAEIISLRTGRAGRLPARHRRPDPRLSAVSDWSSTSPALTPAQIFWAVLSSYTTTRRPRTSGLDVTTAAVLLAAGGGRRFAGVPGSSHKLLAPFRGRPVVAWALDAATGAAIRRDRCRARSGRGRPARRCDSRSTTLGGPTARPARSPSRWSTPDPGATVRSSWDSAISRWSPPRPGVWWARPMVRRSRSPPTPGRRRNPVRLDASVWDQLPRTGDVGARDLIASHPELVQDVPCPGTPVDIDTVEDLQRWS